MHNIDIIKSTEQLYLIVYSDPYNNCPNYTPI